SLVQVADEFFETLFLRHTGSVLVAQAPFADEASVVAGLFEHLGHGQILGPQCDGTVAPYPGMPGVQAGHQRATGGCAHRAAGIEAGKTDAFSRELVEVRSLDPGLPVTTQIAITKIIRQDENNVR